MTPIINQVETHVEEFRTAVVAAKKQKGFTAQDISDRAGIPLSTVNKYLSGNSTNTNLYYAAAASILLGLSIDDIFGITSGQEDKSDNSDLTARLRELELELSYCKKDRNNIFAVLKARKTIIAVMFGLCIMLVTAIGFTVVYDILIPDKGFVIGGRLAAISIIVLAILFIVVVTTVAVIVLAINRSRK